MDTRQDEIVYKGHRINTFIALRELRVNGKWQSVETRMYSCCTDGHVSQSLDAMYSHIDNYLNPKDQTKK